VVSFHRAFAPNEKAPLINQENQTRIGVRTSETNAHPTGINNNNNNNLLYSPITSTPLRSVFSFFFV
jgi:hypothetical protein